jgi:hypothetical protein
VTTRHLSSCGTRGLIGYGLPRREKSTVGGKWKVETPKFSIIYCGTNLSSVSVTSEVFPFDKFKGTQLGEKYRSAFGLASAVDGSWCSTPRPGGFTTGKEHFYLFYIKMGGPKSRSHPQVVFSSGLPSP